MTQQLDPQSDFDAWLLTEQGRRWRALHPPIAGGDGTGDGDADGDGDGDGEPAAGDGDGEPAGSGDGDGDGDGDGEPQGRGRRQQRRQPPAPAAADDDDDDDDGEDELVKARKEAAQAKRRAAEAEREAKRLKREAEKHRQREQQRQGEYEQLYTEEKQRRETLEIQVQTKALKASVRDWATKVGFRNPSMAADLVMPQLKVDDVVDEDLEVDEQAVEKALKDLAKREPYMVRTTRQQRDDLNGQRDTTRRRAATNGDSEDKTRWNPAETLRGAYSGSS